MKQPSIYLKMKVLGAIDVAPGKTRDQRVRNVAQMTFLDEEANQYRFTWRTIQTWYYRYKNHGVTSRSQSFVLGLGASCVIRQSETPPPRERSNASFAEFVINS